jgi:TolA-binding protein
MKNISGVCVVCLGGLFLAGCVATTTDIDRLQDSLDKVQKSQADLMVKIDELDQTLTVLNEKLGESQKKMTNLTQKLDDSQSRLGGRMESISQLLSAATTQASVPVPGDVYRLAYNDYFSGKLDLAISGFKTFLERYPESDLTDDAQFYLADCYLSKKEYAQAVVEFDKVLSVSQEFRARALLKRAYALQGTKQAKDEIATLRTILKEFPQSQEAEGAKLLLKEAEEASKPKAIPKPKTPVASPSEKKGAQ